MARWPLARWTTRRMVGLVASVAIAFALIDAYKQGRPWVMLVVPVVVLITLALAFVHYLTTPFLGVGCPYCGRKALERRSVASFGPRFYHCSHCGVRCMRTTLGGWKDALGSKHDHLYEKKRDADPWTAAPGLEDEDLVAFPTHQDLVRSKRNRRPENPNGPGLE